MEESNFMKEQHDKLKLEKDQLKVEPIIKTKGLKILVVDGSGEQKSGEFLFNSLLKNGNKDFKPNANGEGINILVEDNEDNKDDLEPAKEVKKESDYKGTVGFGGIEVMRFDSLTLWEKSKVDVERLKSCLLEADVVLFVSASVVCDIHEIRNALWDATKSKLLISCGNGNYNFIDGVLSEECKFSDEKLGENYINVLKFIAYKTNKGVLNSNSIRRNKVKTGIGLLTLEEFLGQSLFRKSILGAVLGYNSNSKSRNGKDVKDNKETKDDKGKKDNTVVQNAKK